MGELEDDIRSTAESIAEDSERLKTIEVEKTQLTADAPELLELSAEAERIGDRLAAETHAEDELVREASQDEA
jgi:hypothetical protein